MKQQHESSEDRRRNVVGALGGRSDEMRARILEEQRILEEKVRREEEEIKHRRVEERRRKVEARRQGDHLRLKLKQLDLEEEQKLEAEQKAEELLQREEELRRKDEELQKEKEELRREKEAQRKKAEELWKKDDELWEEKEAQRRKAEELREEEEALRKQKGERERRYMQRADELRTAEQIQTIVDADRNNLKSLPGPSRRPPGDRKRPSSSSSQIQPISKDSFVSSSSAVGKTLQDPPASPSENHDSKSPRAATRISYHTSGGRTPHPVDRTQIESGCRCSIM